MEGNGDKKIGFRIALLFGKTSHHLRQTGSVVEFLLVFVLVNQIRDGLAIMKGDDCLAIGWAMLLALSTDTVECGLVGAYVTELDFPREQYLTRGAKTEWAGLATQCTFGGYEVIK